MKSAIILAAGKGTRMNSNLPKTMHKVCDKPMVEHIVDNLKSIDVEKIVTVVGYKHEVLRDYLKDKTEYALQEEQLGSGHAVMQVQQLKDCDGITLVANGDCPLITKETYQALYDTLQGNSMVVLTALLDDAKSYGRIITDSDEFIQRIVEHKDASAEERLVKEINVGIYAFDNKVLYENLNKLDSNNSQNEYYITDLVEILNKQGLKVKALRIADPMEASGINDRIELTEASMWLQNKINTKHQQQGVTLIDPSQTHIGVDVEIGLDTIIYPNTFLRGKTKIGENCTITSSIIDNSSVKNNTSIVYSQIVNSEIGSNVTVGPYAHIRERSIIGNNARVGNFIEIKKSTIGNDTKAAHLSYIGDSEVGQNVNFGCGIVTVNYDGANKFKTIIGDNAFIGSNVNLIAPIKVGSNAVVAAGSTITDDVEDGDLVIARSIPVVKKDKGMKYVSKKKSKEKV